MIVTLNCTASIQHQANVMQIATTHAVADTGTMLVFVMAGTPANNICMAPKPIQISLPSGTTITSTHICDIVIPGLLFIASIVLQGMGSFGSNGCKHVSMARRGVQSHLTKLSVPLTSTVTDIKSSMYTLVVPCGTTGMSIINYRPSVKGIESSRNSRGAQGDVFSMQLICWNSSRWLYLRTNPLPQIPSRQSV
jgi:hypothetical protein